MAKLGEFKFEKAKSDALKSHTDLNEKINLTRMKMNDIYQREENILPYLIPGRMIHVKDRFNNIDYGWGICINFTRKIINIKSGRQSEIEDGKPQVVVDVLLYLNKKVNNKNQITPGDVTTKDGMLGIVPVTLSTIENLSKVQMKIIYDLKDKTNIQKLERFYFILMEKFSNNPPLLDPVVDMEIKDDEFQTLCTHEATLKKELAGLGAFSEEDLAMWKQREEVRAESRDLE